MNTLQLEQLISGYIDDELSPNRKLEVENLLQNDPTAKTLYDEFVVLRKEIRTIRRRNLPHDFQKQLFERIDRETISVSGKLVEQTTSVDFTLQDFATPQPKKWQRHEPVVKSRQSLHTLLTRLTNPRVWVFPAIALIIGLMFFVVDFSSKDQNVAHVPPASVIVEPVEAPFFVPPPPLDLVGSTPGSDAPQSLAYNKDGKPIVEVMCDLSPSARDSQYIPKLLADNGYSFTMRENGNKPVTVYQFEIPREQILSVLAMLENSNREKLKSYKYPDAFLTLLNRSPEIGDTPGETPTALIVIVRLSVLK